MACCSQRFSECAIDTHARQQRAIEDFTVNIVTKRDTHNHGDPERAVISMICPLKDITKSSLYEPRKKYKTLANALIVNARDVGGVIAISRTVARVDLEVAGAPANLHLR